MSKEIKIGIVGAGIQGISNALFLQKKGFHVTIFDRDNPGAQAASVWVRRLARTRTRRTRRHAASPRIGCPRSCSRSPARRRRRRSPRRRHHRRASERSPTVHRRQAPRSSELPKKCVYHKKLLSHSNKFLWSMLGNSLYQKAFYKLSKNYA